MITINVLEDFDGLVGKNVSDDQLLQINQELLDQFLGFSGDANKIHRTSLSNPRAVIPGNLFISLVPKLLQSQMSIDGSITCFTVGYRMVKFRTPIRLDDIILFNAEILSIRKIGNSRHVEYDFSFRMEGRRKTSIDGRISDIYRNSN